VLNEGKIDPLIQTEYLRSGDVVTLISLVDGAKVVNSCVMLKNSICIQVFSDVYVALHN